MKKYAFLIVLFAACTVFQANAQKLYPSQDDNGKWGYVNEEDEWMSILTCWEPLRKATNGLSSPFRVWKLLLSNTTKCASTPVSTPSKSAKATPKSAVTLAEMLRNLSTKNASCLLANSANSKRNTL